MPEPSTIQRARADARAGKAPSTQAGEFVREEFHHVREGKHGARSARQAIAIGLSKARRAGVNLPLPRRDRVSPKVRHQAERDSARAHDGNGHPLRTRSRATLQALKREGRRAASTTAISRQTRASARRRTPAERAAAARRAVRTKTPAGRKAARTRLAE